MRKLFYVNLYQTCSFVENRRNVHKTHTISFYYITNKYDKSKLETEEHVDDYFTCIYIQLYTSAPCSTCVNFTMVRHQELVNSNVPTKDKYI